MKRYIAYTLLAALFGISTAFGAPKTDGVEVVNCSRKAKTSFAIFVDKATYSACREAIASYREVLESEGLGTYIFAADWQSPEQIRERIAECYKKRPRLEGAVFIGNIPIAKVSGAQHMTTAFKMNEDRFPREEAWVATDRFYDDFDLQFDFVERDSVEQNIYYYRLTENGSQTLEPDIYSARMVVPSMLGDTYAVLNDYLAEVVRAHREQNALDNVIFYAGAGYNSDCLTAWRQKPIVWREYFPYAFDQASHNRFYNFRQGTDVKHKLYNEIQRPEVDYFQFSEHGAPDTQYIADGPTGHSLKSDLEMLKKSLRRYYARYKGTPDEEEFLKECETEFGMPREIFSDSEMAAQTVANEKATAEMNIGLEEIAALKSAPRVMIFNACYNGSFYDKNGYVAGCHVFNGGRTIVAQGNTVNVLQDKYEDQLLGILSTGVRVGMWQKEVPFLESHLIGDPTFRFTPHNATDEQLAREISYNRDEKFWRKQLSASEPVMRAVASKRLMAACKGNAQKEQALSATLLEVIKSDPSWSVRLEALELISQFADQNCTEAVLLSLNDPYERIRRMAADLAGEIGDKLFVEPLKKLVDHADEVVRVQWIAQSSLNVIVPGEADKGGIKVDVITDTSLSNNERINAIRSLRNNHLHSGVDQFTALMCNPDDDLKVRIVMCEALGWFDRSIEREKIFAAVDTLIESAQTPELLRKEAAKTRKRLLHQ
ncbi:MAG: HEAT repeat domain-containing protein [Tidjanibacter sp.]|nr:HEAT repeat domain-containing protein [Tidjanibacter sp.]